MVMVSARLTRRWRLSYRHDLTNAAIAAPRVASSSWAGVLMLPKASVHIRDVPDWTRPRL